MANVVRQDLSEWSRKIDRWAKKFPKAVLRAYANEAQKLVKDIQTKRLSGQILGVVTGRLRASIEAKITSTPRPSLSVGTDVFYGAIWYNRGRDFIRPSIRGRMKFIEKEIGEQIIKQYEAS